MTTIKDLKIGDIIEINEGTNGYVGVVGYITKSKSRLYIFQDTLDGSTPNSLVGESNFLKSPFKYSYAIQSFQLEKEYTKIKKLNISLKSLLNSI